MKATQQLKDEHQGVKTMLSVLEVISEKPEYIDNGHLEGILEFLRVFVDQCHHAKEEELLFPAMIAAGSQAKAPVGQMLREHDTGRGFVREMSRAFAASADGDSTPLEDLVKNARSYISLLRNHIEKEDHVLFPLADTILPEKKQDELYDGFERIEEDRIGHGTHERFHHLIKDLSGLYLRS